MKSVPDLTELKYQLEQANVKDQDLHTAQPERAVPDTLAVSPPVFSPWNLLKT